MGNFRSHSYSITSSVLASEAPGGEEKRRKPISITLSFKQRRIVCCQIKSFFPSFSIVFRSHYKIQEAEWRGENRLVQVCIVSIRKPSQLNLIVLSLYLLFRDNLRFSSLQCRVAGIVYIHYVLRDLTQFCLLRIFTVLALVYLPSAKKKRHNI